MKKTNDQATTTQKTDKKTPQSEHSHDHATAIAPNTILKLVIKADQAKQAYQKAIKKFTPSVKAPGFRKGKVPAGQIEGIIGQEKLINQALNDLLPQAYSDLLKKENKIPLTQPDIKVLKAEIGQDWEIEIQIAQRPQVKLGKYQESVKKANKEANSEIEKQEKELAKEVKKTNLPAQSGNKEESSSAKEEQNKPKLPTTLNNDQKQDIRLRVIFHQLIHDISPQIPELLIQEDVRRQLDDLAHQLEHYKLSFEDYLKRMGTTFEQMTSQMAATSLASLQIEFILAEIITDQDIKISDQDFDQYLKKIESTKTVAELDDQMKSQLQHTIARRKVIDFLLELKK